jgi:hypothetical protein
LPRAPGRSGFGPQVSLTYDSGAGNGPFGFGWSLSIPSITRKTDKGLPKYQDSVESDVFILSGAEDLVPTLMQTPAGKWVPEAVPDRTVGGQAFPNIAKYKRQMEASSARKTIRGWSAATA